MAKIITKRKLTEKEIDDLVAQELSRILISSIYREFMAFDIRDELLRKKEVETSTPEVHGSMQRLCDLGSLEIRISNLHITMAGAGHGLRVYCNVKLGQKIKTI